MVENLSLKHLFKSNYFGKAYIDKYGCAFFENFPAKKIEFITKNLVRIDLVSDILGKMNTEIQKNIANYLKNSISLT